MAAQRERFHDRVVSELRGVVSAEGASPVWEAVGRHFFRMDFSEADIDIRAGDSDSRAGRFDARLLVPGPVVGGRRLERFEGRWIVGRGLVATAVTVPHT